MMNSVPKSHMDLVDRTVKDFAYLATVMAEGTPQVTPVWYEFVDGDILINTSRGRVKDENMTERPDVAVLIVDPRNAYRYIQFRGKVVEVTEKGAEEHINALSRYYTGHDYNLTPDQHRVIYRIRPYHVDAHG